MFANDLSPAEAVISRILGVSRKHPYGFHVGGDVGSSGLRLCNVKGMDIPRPLYGAFGALGIAVWDFPILRGEVVHSGVIVIYEYVFYIWVLAIARFCVCLSSSCVRVGLRFCVCVCFRFCLCSVFCVLVFCVLVFSCYCVVVFLRAFVLRSCVFAVVFRVAFCVSPLCFAALRFLRFVLCFLFLGVLCFASCFGLRFAFWVFVCAFCVIVLRFFVCALCFNLYARVRFQPARRKEP